MLILAVIAMAIQDFLGVLLVVSEARGRYWLAGFLDAASDYAKFLTAGIAGATLVQNGFTAEFVLITAMAITSFIVTSMSTRFARRIKEDEQVD